MSRRAWAYVIGVIAAGAWVAGMVLQQPRPESWQWPVFMMLLALTSLAHLTGSTGAHHEIWQTNLVFLFAGLLMLPPQLFVWLVLIPHILEWIKENLRESTNLRQWYIQPFNIAGHYLAGFGAAWVFARLLPGEGLSFTTGAILAVIVTAAAYITINHFLVGQAIVLGRNIPWKDAGILNWQSLLGELTLLLLGYTLAVLWQLNPLLIIPALAPLVLIYRSLRVPQLEKEAQTDSKTGLYNARRWRYLAENELERAKRFERPLALIMADLDHLRSINNEYGHLAGDVVITGIGKIIQDTVRNYDIASRFGGEEFAIVLPEVDLQRASMVAERIRGAVEAGAFEVRSSDTPIHATITLGVMAYPDDADTLDALIHNADLALYYAKLNGRNRVALATDIPLSARLGQVSVEELRAMAERESAGETESPAVAQDKQTMPSALPANEIPESPPVPVESLAAPVAAGPETESETAKPVSRAHLIRHIAFRSITILAAILISAYGFSTAPATDYLAILLFGFLAVISESFGIKVYHDSSMSVSAAIVFAAALIAGIPGAAIVSALITVVHTLRHRPVYYKVIFNWAAHLLASLAPILALRLLNLDLSLDNLLILLIPIAASALGYFLIETSLIAGAVSLASGRDNVMAVWQESFQWLAEHYLVLGILGFFLAIAYTTLGIAGTFVFTLPVFMMYYVERQYTARTERSVLELRRMNEELTAANRQIVDASQSIQRQNDELFLTLSKAIDARDPYVLGHAAQVAKYAEAIAVTLGLPAGRIEQLRQAGFLHDIGKIGISEAILHKADRLTDEEMAHVKAHVSIGANLLETSHSLRHLAPFIRHHHERWDGNGYPDGLAGENIPLEARILAVCDAVEAMASDRPYNAAKSLDDIVVEIKRCTETQFDPAVVAAFVQVIAEQGAEFVINSAPEVRQNHSADEAHSLRFGELFAKRGAVEAAGTSG